MTATTKHSRRTVLAGMAAGSAVATTAATAVAVIPTTGPDPLLAMEAEYLAAWDAWGNAITQLDEADIAQSPATPALEAAMEVADKHALALLKKIVITPAVSPEGVAVKFRLAEHISAESVPDSFGFDLAQVARLDAARLAAGGVA